MPGGVVSGIFIRIYAHMQDLGFIRRHAPHHHPIAQMRRCDEVDVVPRRQPFGHARPAAVEERHVFSMRIIHEHSLRAAGGEERDEIVAQPAVRGHHHVRVARVKQVSYEAWIVGIRNKVGQNKYVGCGLGKSAAPCVLRLQCAHNGHLPASSHNPSYKVSIKFIRPTHNEPRDDQHQPFLSLGQRLQRDAIGLHDGRVDGLEV
mmetsp:Transcript_11664/g.19011  ORF Transcript_11664/g.19011 Transcript_11664/m.19011 type:complete len:204 (-) Transcript_11664:184-795(-)